MWDEGVSVKGKSEMSVEGWNSYTLEQCCEILDSKRFPVNGEDREKRIGEIPYYGANRYQFYSIHSRQTGTGFAD